ncbi:hypothetical protein [Spiroplasma endosymbiont of Nomada rufipes]|uniref:hypothetical protein n=1 Tax=Spiroplasma endosymbiont of Nomada rufipes TaxID=3077933 RepID=UPI00376EC873
MSNLIKRNNAIKLIKYEIKHECVIDGKKALYHFPHLNLNQFGGDVNLCSSCIKKYDKGQIKLKGEK